MAKTLYKNFQAASRRPNMIPFGLMPLGTDLTWIPANVEVPDVLVVTGTVNGVNQSFTVDDSYTSMWVFLDGMLMTATTDYTWTPGTKTIAFVVPPPTGSAVVAIGGWTQA